MKQIGIMTVTLLVTCGFACGQPAHQEADIARYRNDPNAPETISLLGRPLYANPPASEKAKLESDLRRAEANARANPGNPDLLIWVGRRLGYLWRMTDAINVFTSGIERHRKYAPLYRHRGHRYITVRQFDNAIADLQSAARLISGTEDVIEQDGMPNARNIPLTTLHFNVHYHLGVARYLKGDFSAALDAFGEAMKAGGKYDDNVVAVTDWMYMALRRMDRDEEAAKLLEPINEGMDIIENKAYFQRLLMYKGLISPESLLDVQKASDLDLATMGYGVGNWRLCNGDRNGAKEIFEKVVAGGYWPAFGYIAAEADLARMKK
ncbi:MAG: hypothetical protein AMXMBFR20_17530 [Planctomycetia bacterium]|nr:hypothetical protein [Planctomycetota bacterium]